MLRNSHVEIDTVVQVLRAATCDGEIADLLRILGDGWAFQHEDLIARFLACQSNQIVVHAAFTILSDD